LKGDNPLPVVLEEPRRTATSLYQTRLAAGLPGGTFAGVLLRQPLERHLENAGRHAVQRGGGLPLLVRSDWLPQGPVHEMAPEAGVLLPGCRHTEGRRTYCISEFFPSSLSTGCFSSDKGSDALRTLPRGAGRMAKTPRLRGSDGALH